MLDNILYCDIVSLMNNDRVLGNELYPLDSYNGSDGFSLWLIKWRTRFGLRQLDIAKALHVSVKQVNRWENEWVFPCYQNLIALCKLFGIKPNTIFKEVVAQREKHYIGKHRITKKGRMYELPAIRCIPKT